jgi:hypothetical protein
MTPCNCRCWGSKDMESFTAIRRVSPVSSSPSSLAIVARFAIPSACRIFAIRSLGVSKMFSSIVSLELGIFALLRQQALSCWGSFVEWFVSMSSHEHNLPTSLRRNNSLTSYGRFQYASRKVRSLIRTHIACIPSWWCRKVGVCDSNSGIHPWQIWQHERQCGKVILFRQWSSTSLQML